VNDGGDRTLKWWEESEEALRSQSELRREVDSLKEDDTTDSNSAFPNIRVFLWSH
jgi:hypothetical protein